jgi:hypothetical protein
MKKRRSFHYFLNSLLFSFTVPLFAALKLGDIRICRFATTGLFSHMYRRSMRKKHVPQHNDAWIVVVIVLVMMIIIIIIIINCAVSSVT